MSLIFSVPLVPCSYTSLLLPTSKHNNSDIKHKGQAHKITIYVQSQNRLLRVAHSGQPSVRSSFIRLPLLRPFHAFPGIQRFTTGRVPIN